MTQLKGWERMWRVGLGIDAHRFAPDRPLILCGVTIPHESGLSGHSDADVALHALCDALLGAMGLGDIGQHFPDSDPRYKDAPSRLFVEAALIWLRERNWGIANVDITLIAQKPQLAPYRESMRAKVAELLGISVDRVSVKATTTDRMGFTGRGEGIVAIAVVLLHHPGKGGQDDGAEKT